MYDLDSTLFYYCKASCLTAGCGFTFSSADGVDSALDFWRTQAIGFFIHNCQSISMFI